MLQEVCSAVLRGSNTLVIGKCIPVLGFIVVPQPKIDHHNIFSLGLCLKDPWERKIQYMLGLQSTCMESGI